MITIAIFTAGFCLGCAAIMTWVDLQDNSNVSIQASAMLLVSVGILLILIFIIDAQPVQTVTQDEFRCLLYDIGDSVD